MIYKTRYENMLVAREKAANRIQHAWRRTKKKDIFTVIKAYKNMHATTIQRYMKGFYVS